MNNYTFMRDSFYSCHNNTGIMIIFIAKIFNVLFIVGMCDVSYSCTVQKSAALNIHALVCQYQILLQMKKKLAFLA